MNSQTGNAPIPSSEAYDDLFVFESLVHAPTSPLPVRRSEAAAASGQQPGRNTSTPPPPPMHLLGGPMLSPLPLSSLLESHRRTPHTSSHTYLPLLTSTTTFPLLSPVKFASMPSSGRPLPTSHQQFASAVQPEKACPFAFDEKAMILHQRGPFQSPLPHAFAGQSPFQVWEQNRPSKRGEEEGEDEEDDDENEMTEEEKGRIAKRAAETNNKKKMMKTLTNKTPTMVQLFGSSDDEEEDDDDDDDDDDEEEEEEEEEEEDRAATTTTNCTTPYGSQGSIRSRSSSQASFPTPSSSATLPAEHSVLLYEILRQSIANFKTIQVPRAWLERVAATIGCTYKQATSKLSNMKMRNCDRTGRALPFNVDISKVVNKTKLAAYVAKFKPELHAMIKELGLSENVALSTPIATPSSLTSHACTTAATSAGTSAVASTMSRRSSTRQLEKQDISARTTSPIPAIDQDMVDEGNPSPVLLKLSLPTSPTPTTAEASGKKKQNKKDNKKRKATTPSPAAAGPALLPMPTPQQLVQVAQATGLGLQEVLNVCKKVREVMVVDWTSE